MKLFGSIRELVSAVFRKNSQEITVQPNSGTYVGTVTLSLPPTLTGSSTLVDTSSTQTLSGKTLSGVTIDADVNTISNIENADIKAGAAIDATKIADGSVTSTEFQYINTLSSNAQTQLDGKQPLDSDLTAIAALATTGFVARTGAGTAATRTITANSTKISITNGAGTAADPTVDVVEANLTHDNIGGTLSISKGGTSGVTAQAARTNLLPSQAGNSGKVLGTDGTDVSFVNVASDPTTTRGDLIRRGAAALERLPAATNNRVVRGDGTDVISGQIDAPGFFTTGAAASASDIGIVTTAAQTLAGAKTLTGTLRLDSTDAKLQFYENDQGSNLKLWDLTPQTQVLNLRTRTDADGTANTLMTISRAGALAVNPDNQSASHSFRGQVSFANEGITVPNTTNGEVCSGSYTPTYTRTGSTITQIGTHYWYRVGNQVTVQGYVNNIPATASPNDVLISLPITPSAFSSDDATARTQCGGYAGLEGNSSVRVWGEVSGTRARILGSGVGVAAQSTTVLFTYRVS